MAGKRPLTMVRDQARKPAKMFRAGLYTRISIKSTAIRCRCAPCGICRLPGWMIACTSGRSGPEIWDRLLLLFCEILVSRLLDTLDSRNRAHKPAANTIGPFAFEADGGVSWIQRKQDDLLMYPGTIQ